MKQEVRVELAMEVVDESRGSVETGSFVVGGCGLPFTLTKLASLRFVLVVIL